MSKALALANLMVVSLLVLASSVRSSSASGILNLDLQTYVTGIDPETSTIIQEGAFWGDLEGTVESRSFIVKMSGSTIHAVPYCSWTITKPYAGWMKLEGMGIVDYGTEDWVMGDEGSCVINEQIVDASESYQELIGSRTHAEGTFALGFEGTYHITP